MSMNPKDFISRLDENRIVSAIADAEKKTSGEIRVYISRKPRPNAFAFAKKRFLALGMTKTRHRNAVLIYVVPRQRTFAVIGDVGVHQKCGEAFWQETVGSMSEMFKAEKFTDALVHGVEKVGTLLAAHFPRGGDDSNQLPNALIED